MSLTYHNPEQSPGGKTSVATDTFQGTFVELVPDEKIVEIIEFESQDPGFAGEMKMTTSFIDTDEGTEVTVLCEEPYRSSPNSWSNDRPSRDRVTYASRVAVYALLSIRGKDEGTRT